jgi:hypothetical protein
MSKWVWGYIYWGAIWLGLGFLAAEILGELKVAPWPTLSETVWHSEDTYVFWVAALVFGLSVFFVLHFLLRKPLVVSVEVAAMASLALHLADKRLP